jgi:hypothetical protein
MRCVIAEQHDNATANCPEAGDAQPKRFAHGLCSQSRNVAELAALMPGFQRESEAQFGAVRWTAKLFGQVCGGWNVLGLDAFAAGLGRILHLRVSQLLDLCILLSRGQGFAPDDIAVRQRGEDRYLRAAG